MPGRLKPILRDEFKLTTWLCAGALIQALIFLVYPSRLAVLPTFLIVAQRIFVNLLLRWGFLSDPNSSIVHWGRKTAQIVGDDGSIPENGSQKDIVVFILGMCANDAARGRSDPIIVQTGDMFEDMWSELRSNAKKWGFLGKTSTLVATDKESSNTLVWISYWTSLEKLSEFAQSKVHRKAADFYNKQLPRGMGIMHEAYSVPAGNWETIYANFVPFGLGQARQTVESASGEKTADGKPRYASGIMDAKGPVWRSMKSRMRGLSTDTLQKGV